MDAGVIGHGSVWQGMQAGAQFGRLCRREEHKWHKWCGLLCSQTTACCLIVGTQTVNHTSKPPFPAPVWRNCKVQAPEVEVTRAPTIDSSASTNAWLYCTGAASRPVSDATAPWMSRDSSPLCSPPDNAAMTALCRERSSSCTHATDARDGCRKYGQGAQEGR